MCIRDRSVAKLDVRYKPPFEMRVFRSEIGVMPEASGWHRLSFDLSFDYGTHSFPKFLPAKLALEHPIGSCTTGTMEMRIRNTPIGTL